MFFIPFSVTIDMEFLNSKYGIIQSILHQKIGFFDIFHFPFSATIKLTTTT